VRVAILIPAYKPTQALVAAVSRLDESYVDRIVVVDDGSGPEYASLFEAVKCSCKAVVLRHAVNLGKGAALKTGMNACLCEDPDTLVVTADADGQHLPDDILHVAAQGRAQRDALVLGSRGFDADVPLRSRIGNVLTRHVLRIVLGYALADTQTGLRAVPAALAQDLLRLSSHGYEFELDMLIRCKRLGVPILQVPIQTVYLERNASSHFNPLLDSMRIYFTLVRFVFASLTTALLDNIAFALLYALLAPSTSVRMSVLASQAGARVVAVVYNFVAAKRLVFASTQRTARLLPRYLLLVALAGTTSYMMITYLAETLGFPVLVAKLVAEGMLFLPNFVIQRDLVFQSQDEAADRAA
jgi:putative flippase GtrA